MALLSEFLSYQLISNEIPHWKLIDGWWCPAGEDCNDGTANCYIIVIRDGNPFLVDGRCNEDLAPCKTSLVHQFWPGGDINLSAKLNAAGQAQSDFEMSATWDPARDPRGPYGIYIEGRSKSDVISGIGERLNRHEQFWFVFEWQEASGPPPDSTPTDERMRQIAREEINKARVVAAP